VQLQFSHPSISDSEFVERIEQKKASFYRVAFGYTRNEDDALEVVQEAVCKAYTAKWRLRDPERFYPWFYRILTNTAPLSFLRGRRDAFSIAPLSVRLRSGLLLRRHSGVFI